MFMLINTIIFYLLRILFPIVCALSYVIYITISFLQPVFKSLHKSKKEQLLPQEGEMSQKSKVVNVVLAQKPVFLVLDKGVFGVPFNETLNSVFDWCKENKLVIRGSQDFWNAHDFKESVGLVENLRSDTKELRGLNQRIVFALKPSVQSFKFIDYHLEKIEISFLKENEEIRSFSSNASFTSAEQFDLIFDTLAKKHGNPLILDMDNNDLQVVLDREYLSKYIYHNVGISSHAGCTLVSWNGSIVIYASPNDLKLIDGKLKFTGNYFSVLYFYYPLTEKIKHLKECAENELKQRKLREHEEREKLKKESAMDNF